MRVWVEPAGVGVRAERSGLSRQGSVEDRNFRAEGGQRGVV